MKSRASEKEGDGEKNTDCTYIEIPRGRHPEYRWRYIDSLGGGRIETARARASVICRPIARHWSNLSPDLDF